MLESILPMMACMAPNSAFTLDSESFLAAPRSCVTRSPMRAKISALTSAGTWATAAAALPMPGGDPGGPAGFAAAAGGGLLGGAVRPPAAAIENHLVRTG